jgi:hypothetical protein
MEQKTPAERGIVSESLLGLDPKLVEKTPPLPDPVAWVKHGRPGAFTPSAARGLREVGIRWGESGGSIDFKLGEMVGGDGLPVPNSPVVVNTYFRAGEAFDAKRGAVKRNPREGLAALLTMLAAVNKAASRGGRGFLHVARANELSRPYFERFVESGLYHYCDEEGKKVDKPVEKGRVVLFACELPVEGLERVLDKFSVPRAVSLLTRISEKRPDN